MASSLMAAKLRKHQKDSEEKTELMRKIFHEKQYKMRLKKD